MYSGKQNSELFLNDEDSLRKLEEVNNEDDAFLVDIIKSEIETHNKALEEKINRDKERQLAYEDKINSDNKPEWFVKNFEKITEENVMKYTNISVILKRDNMYSNTACRIVFKCNGIIRAFEFPYTYESICGEPVFAVDDLPRIKTQLMLLKAALHEAIYKYGHTELIDGVYNVIFNDKYYDSMNIKTVDELLSASEQKKLIAAYHEKELQLRRRLESKWKPYRFEKGEIVGAKDSEGRWWMSRVLDVIVVDGQSVYYVEYLGWGHQFNRLITTPWEIKKYNPYKHKYFYPAWRRKLEANQAKQEKELLKDPEDIN